MAAHQPAQPATEGVAEDADIGRRAREVGESMLSGCLGERASQDPRLDARAPSDRVDRDAVHPTGLEEQDVITPLDGAGVMPARVEGDAQSSLGRPAHGGHDILSVLRPHDGDGPLVHRQVPRLPVRLPARVTGQDHVAGQPSAQVAQAGRCEVVRARHGSGGR
jgi:hypothetical protein